MSAVVFLLWLLCDSQCNEVVEDLRVNEIRSTQHSHALHKCFPRARLLCKLRLIAQQTKTREQNTASVRMC